MYSAGMKPDDEILKIWQQAKLWKELNLMTIKTRTS